MVIRAGVIILAAALVCCSAQAQSLLLDNGESSWDLQVGFVGVDQSSGASGGVGYSFSRLVGLGVHTNVLIEDGGYYGGNSTDVTFGPHLDIYPLRARDQAVAFVLGLHGSATFQTGAGSRNVTSFGASANLILGADSKSGVVLKAGGVENSVSGASQMTESGVVGLEVFFRSVNRGVVRLIFEYGATEGTSSFAGGFGISFGGTKAKS